MMGSWEHSYPPDAIGVEIILCRNCMLLDIMCHCFFSSNACILSHCGISHELISHMIICKTCTSMEM
jgi:hypothetical protein